MTAAREQIAEAVEEAAERSGFTLDVDQRLLLGHLADVSTQKARRRRSADLFGTYVHGPPGRGKSWIANAVFEAAPGPKTRAHSHEFFQRLHARVHREQNKFRAVDRAFGDIIGSGGLFVFDELHIHDPGDARLFTRLLEHVLNHDSTLIVTSNYAPNDLLPNPVWHHTMEDGIALITGNLAIHHLSSAVDYRTKHRPGLGGFSAGAWISSSSDDGFARTNSTSLRLGGRTFQAVTTDDDHLTITFEQICGSPLSTIEYVHWAKTFQRWTILDIPRFGAMGSESQQRFINLIDILVDRDVRTTFCSVHTIDEFLTSAVTMRPDASRMASRMQLLHLDE
ncbi:cell division protein ZapE [Williamsia sp. M5A3_1d]